MHPLDKLRLRIAGTDRGDILHRRIGQCHPRRIAFLQSGILPEKLPECSGVSRRRSYFGILLQKFCKRRHSFLVLVQGIAQMPQHWNNAHQQRRQGMRSCDIADCLLLHREL